ncbi:MAG: LysM peptidoglycan-binding domain-containing protein [Clostridia bacterium]|nr:LysM peptidoglycan-binding domain-containing protein [Clostridia bacterium]
MIIHTVSSGETVFSIAARYGISEQLLEVNNGLQNVRDSLPIGLGLVILIPSEVYTVRAGDTLRSVAARFGITLNDLYRRNLILGGRDEIFDGQTLVIEYVDRPIYDFSVGGYYYTFVSDDILNTSLPLTKLFMPFTYGFTPTGEIVEINDEKLLERGYYYSSAPYFHLSTLTETGAFSNELASALFKDRALWSTLADNIIAVMQAKGYVGLDIDFEFIDASDRELYAQFIGYMRTRVNEYSYRLIVALPPKTSATQQGQLYEGVDYRLLGEAADYCLLMTYEWGYTYGPPMPVSPTPSIRRVLDYAVSEIPPQKIYMGISNYGYDWKLPYIRGESRAVSLSNTEAVELASHTGSEIFYSDEYEAPYFNYTDNDGNRHEVWFEDARSIAAKLALIKEYGFHGGLYWNLNRENPQNLSYLSSAMNYQN